MPDVGLEWGTDFALTPAGDLTLVDGGDLTRQRIERRLFTAVRGYLWHLDYGAGLPQKVGSTYQRLQIESIVRGQLLLEASVNQTPPPKIAVSQPTPGVQVIRIDYTESGTGRQIGFTISV